MDTNVQPNLPRARAHAAYRKDAQATFLHAQFLADADWVGLVQQLNYTMWSGIHPSGAMRRKPNLL